MDAGHRVIVTPVIVDEHGDVSFFESVEHAEGKLEAIEVRNEEFVAYDSEGRLLKLDIERAETSTFFGLGETMLEYVVIESARDRPNHAPQLRAALVRFFERVGVPPDDSDHVTLRELVRGGVERSGFTV